MTKEEYYAESSKYEKLTMILTASLNEILDSISFDTYVRIILCAQKENDLDFYIWQNGVEVGHFARKMDPTIRYSEEEILYGINRICTETDNPKSEEDRRIPIDLAKNIGLLDNSQIYILPVACSEGYPKGLLWQKLYEFYVEGWREIIEDEEEQSLFEYNSPQEALKQLCFDWNWTTVACCRALSEGGFNTGYGDPYESEFLFDLIDEVASLNYEKRTSKGTIVAVPDVLVGKFETLIRLVDSIPLNEKLAKTYRKLFEMTTDKIALAFGDYRVLGLVDASLFEWKIIILGQGKWKYYYKDQVIFTVENGKITIGKEASQVNYHLPDDEDLSIANPEIVEKIIQEAMKQEHGTCLLFAENADEEAKRLAQYRRCIRIDPINLYDYPEMIISLSSIDGAIIVDFLGNCFGVGAILDGEAHHGGDYGRGARYNSALNYIGWKKETDNSRNYCAVVISEDGVHDIISTKALNRIIDNLDDLFEDSWGNG